MFDKLLTTVDFFLPLALPDGVIIHPLIIGISKGIFRPGVFFIMNYSNVAFTLCLVWFHTANISLQEHSLCSFFRKAGAAKSKQEEVYHAGTAIRTWHNDRMWVIIWLT